MEDTKRPPSRPTRITGDLAESLEQLLPVLGMSSAEYLDPLIRVQIQNDMLANAKAIKAQRLADEAVREARERAIRARNEQLAEAVNNLGGEGELGESGA